MPTLEELNRRMCVVILLQQRERKNEETDKASYQQWVKGVFKEATEKKEHTRDDIVGQHVEQNKKAKLF